MKTTVVPAQVTTVEDKIAGNLSFTQLLLLVTPVFIDAALFVIFPPIFGFSFLKLIIGGALALFCMTLAIRIRGKILLHWITVIVRYRLRPSHYLFNKNDLSQRTHQAAPEQEPEVVATETIETNGLPMTMAVSPSLLARAELAATDPRANFHISFKKGGSRVHIREVKEESL